MNVHSSTINNSQMVGTIQMAFNNKMLYIHTVGVFFSHKKEWSSDTCNNNEIGSAPDLENMLSKRNQLQKTMYVSLCVKCLD